MKNGVQDTDCEVNYGKKNTKMVAHIASAITRVFDHLGTRAYLFPSAEVSAQLHPDHSLDGRLNIG